MRFEHETTPFGVNERMALASIDLLSSIVTARAAGLGSLDALAVNDRGRGASVAPYPFAICHHERVVYPFKAPVVAPGCKPAVNRPPRRQVVRQQTPRAARPHGIVAHRPLAWPAHRAGFGMCGAITRHSASVRSVWYRVTGRLCCCRVVGVHMAKSKVGSRNPPLESRRAPMTQLFSKTVADKSPGA